VNVSLIVLRILHVGFGVFWAGSLFFMTSLLMPAVRGVGPAGGQVMRQLVVVKKLSVRLATAAIITVLSGIILYMMDTKLSAGAFARSRMGMVFGLGGLSALLALIPGVGIVARTVNKVTVLGDAIAARGGPPTAEQSAEMARLQATIGKGSQATAGLVGIAVLCMAVARYV
jgi:hypothetical protein